MFTSCTSLTKAPELPATSLAPYCYHFMFYGCVSLTKAPELPATKLEELCYSYMFYWCTKLNNVTMLATDVSADACLMSWIDEVSSTGTFIKAKSMTSLPIGASGIPEGWIVEDYKE
jgi:hypothetical protein